MKYILIWYVTVYLNSVPQRYEQIFNSKEECEEAQRALFYPSAVRYPPWFDHAWKIQSSCGPIK